MEFQTFDIPHKISETYTEKYNSFIQKLWFEELLDLRAHTCFLNAPGHYLIAKMSSVLLYYFI